MFSSSIFASDESNVNLEVINLYESKSLDQMVLENLNEEVEIEKVAEISNEANEIETNEVEVKQIEIATDNFIYKNNTKELKIYFDNLKSIKSKILQKQIIEVLENLQLNFENDKDKEIFFLIIKYLQSVGQINKSYELIKTYELSDDKNINFYTNVKLNYLLSTFQLNEACNFKEELSSNLDFFFLDFFLAFVANLNA